MVKIAGFIATLLPCAAFAQADAIAPAGWADDPPSLNALVEIARGESPLRVAVQRYSEDIAAIERRYPVAYSPARTARLRKHHEGWRQQLAELDFASLGREGQLDYLTLRNRIAYNLDRLELDEERAAQIAPLVPFFDDVRL